MTIQLRKVYMNNSFKINVFQKKVFWKQLSTTQLQILINHDYDIQLFLTIMYVLTTRLFYSLAELYSSFPRVKIN